MKIEATRLINNSLGFSLVNFVDVTSYTKNQAVKNKPMAKSTSVRVAKIAGFTGLTYRAIDSMLSYKIKYFK